MFAIRARTSASQACGSTSFSFVLVISMTIAAARSKPRTGEAPAFPTEREAFECAFGGIVGQSDATIVEEGGEAFEAVEHIGDRLCDG